MTQLFRFKEVELDKEGQELAAALHLGTNKLSEALGQSVGRFLNADVLWSCQLLPDPTLMLSSIWLAM